MAADINLQALETDARSTMALSLLLICNGLLVIAYCAAQGRRGPVPLLSRRLLTTVGGANATS